MKLISYYFIMSLICFSQLNADVNGITDIDLESIGQDSLNTSLMSAIESNNFVAVQVLVAHGADVNATIRRADLVNICPILLAIRNPEILEFLISAGAHIDKQISLGKTILHIAAQNKDTYKTLDLLLRYGAEVNAIDIYGKTPLHYCIHIKQNALILMEYGADIYLPDYEGWKPLHRGYQQLDIDLLRKFIELGSSLNEFTPEGKNVLHLVCHMNGYEKLKKMDLLKFLVEECGMDVNQYSKWANGAIGFLTPFMFAVASMQDDNFEALEYLLKHGADINTKIFHVLHDGRRHILHNSVLHWAIESKLPHHVIQWLRNQL